jgi:hypothetical protein
MPVAQIELEAVATRRFAVFLVVDLEVLFGVTPFPVTAKRVFAIGVLAEEPEQRCAAVTLVINADAAEIFAAWCDIDGLVKAAARCEDWSIL